MAKGQRLTAQETQQLKAVIRTGEPIAAIADRMASRYNRPVDSFRMTLYNLAKRTKKIATWNGPKKRRTKNTTQPAAPVMETSTVRTPSQRVTRVERYDDHIRIYF